MQLWHFSWQLGFPFPPRRPGLREHSLRKTELRDLSWALANLILYMEGQRRMRRANADPAAMDSPNPKGAARVTRQARHIPLCYVKKQKCHLFMEDWIKVYYCKWCQVTSRTFFNQNIKNPFWHITPTFQKQYLLYTSHFPRYDASAQLLLRRSLGISAGISSGASQESNWSPASVMLSAFLGALFIVDWKEMKRTN